MSCTCHAMPHENWCSEATKGMDIDDVTNTARGTGLHPSKSVMVDFGGDYLPVASVRAEFYRGEFVLVIAVTQ